MSQAKPASSGEKPGSNDDEEIFSDSHGNSEKVPWERRRQHLNEKYASELDASQAMTAEELRRLRRCARYLEIEAPDLRMQMLGEYSAMASSPLGLLASLRVMGCIESTLLSGWNQNFPRA
jgi:hypothetical protein